MALPIAKTRLLHVISKTVNPGALNILVMSEHSATSKMQFLRMRIINLILKTDK